MGDKWFFPIGIAGGADFADPAIAAPGGAVFAPVENNLQVQGIPVLSGEQFFQVPLCLGDTFALG